MNKNDLEKIERSYDQGIVRVNVFEDPIGHLNIHFMVPKFPLIGDIPHYRKVGCFGYNLCDNQSYTGDLELRKMIAERYFKISASAKACGIHGLRYEDIKWEH